MKINFCIKKIWIEGMKSQSCTDRLAKALVTLPGVIRSLVNLKEKYAVVEVEADLDDVILRDEVIKAGYEVREIILL